MSAAAYSYGAGFPIRCTSPTCLGAERGAVKLRAPVWNGRRGWIVGWVNRCATCGYCWPALPPKVPQVRAQRRRLQRAQQRELF